jgi:hypothetical protein
MDPANVLQRRQHARAAWLWSQRRHIEGTPAERYLRGRAITCVFPATLAYLPARNGYAPSLIAAFGIPEEPEPGTVGEPHDVHAVHITRLLLDGSDRERCDRAKIMIGRSLGLPIVVAPVNDLGGLAVCEGIEDALTVHQAIGLGAWAAGSASRMPALAKAIPEYVESVSIFGHDDAAGRDGAHRLAESLNRRAVDVVIEGL